MAALLPLCISGCSAGKAAPQSKVIAPEDMPDICQDLDFNRDKEYHELCGVKGRDYMAYRNVPEHRNLLQPKGGKIIKKGQVLELRLPGTLPVPLPESMAGKFVFDETRRRNFIKSRMDYCEFFPDQTSERVKIFKLEIPQDMGGEATVCFTVESKPSTVQRKTGYASRLEPLACGDFTRLKALSIAKAAEEQKAEENAVDNSAESPKETGEATSQPEATEESAPQASPSGRVQDPG